MTERSFRERERAIYDGFTDAERQRFHTLSEAQQEEYLRVLASEQETVEIMEQVGRGEVIRCPHCGGTLRGHPAGPNPLAVSCEQGCTRARVYIG